ncbi:MAG: helix-turn-helix domain-containing protein [Chloroflexi bacterium]|nr:helix-turn-helix domain-containing protein [Chloroflexota bacterium]
MTTTPTTDPNELLNIPETAAYLRVGKATVQRWCKEGKLPAVKIGKEYRVRRRDIDAWYERLRVQPVSE